MSVARADKLVRAQAIAQALNAITRLHEEEFRVAERPVADAPEQVDAEATRKTFVEAALKGISIFKRADRRAATEDAVRRADAATAEATRRRTDSCRAEQAQLDRVWASIVSNDRDAVMQQLAAAFEDNAAPAAPLAVEGSEATVTVLVPEEHSIPDQMPGITAAGNPSIRKMTKKERDGLLGLLVSGYVLATVKEAFAVAPGLTSLRIVAVRSAGLSAYGQRRSEAMVAALIHREALVGVHWAKVDAHTVLKDVASEVILNERGANRALHPLDLSREPGLASIMDIIDFVDVGDA
jgi:hypothetical protein